MAGMGSLGGGKSDGGGGVIVSVDGAGSLTCIGVIGAVSAGGATGSEATGVGAGSAAGIGAGTGSGAAGGVGAKAAGAALASGTPRSVFGFSTMCAAFFASGGRNNSTSVKKRS